MSHPTAARRGRHRPRRLPAHTARSMRPAPRPWPGRARHPHHRGDRARAAARDALAALWRAVQRGNSLAAAGLAALGPFAAGQWFLGVSSLVVLVHPRYPLEVPVNGTGPRPSRSRASGGRHRNTRTGRGIGDPADPASGPDTLTGTATSANATSVNGGSGAASVLPLYTPKAAAEVLAVRESWLRRRVAAREIPCTFLGRNLRFSHADLVAIVQAAAQPAAQPLVPVPGPGAAPPAAAAPRVARDRAPGCGQPAFTAAPGPARRRGPNGRIRAAASPAPSTVTGTAAAAAAGEGEGVGSWRG